MGHAQSGAARRAAGALAAGLALMPGMALAAGRPALAGVPVDFMLFALVLLGVALFHHHTLRVAVWGAFFNRLSSRGWLPCSISRISWRMAIMASQNRSSSAFDSLSVGSIISVPATGHDMVGAW